MSACQERVLWERVIRGRQPSGELLQAAATATAEQEAFHLMSAWHLNPAEFDVTGNDDARAFASWPGRVPKAEARQCLAISGCSGSQWRQTHIVQWLAHPRV